MKRERHDIVDVAALALGLGEPHRSGHRLDGRDLARERPLQVDVVAPALEHLATALGQVHEPRPAGDRAEVAPDQQADGLAVQRRTRIVEQFGGMPLVADGADRPPAACAAATIASASSMVRAIGFSR